MSSTEPEDELGHEITVAAAGEMLMTRRVSVFEEERFLSLMKILRSADAAFYVSEGVPGNFKGWRLPGASGTPMVAESYIADEARWMGFNLVAVADNHVMDYGPEALASALASFDRVGLVHAGAGKDLTEAREPGYLETKKGRVALIAAHAQEIDGGAEPTSASASGTGWPGRPGVNPLRWDAFYRLPPETFEELRRVASVLKAGELVKTGEISNMRSSSPQRANMFPTDVEEEFHFMGHRFFVGKERGVVYVFNKSDLNWHFKLIRDAKKQGDWVFMSLHDGPSDRFAGTEWGGAPHEATRRFAHDCIDAGADAFLGHGDHKGRGLEIYKGKPIFYSLGTFLCQSIFVRRFPVEEYEKYGQEVGSESTPIDWVDTRTELRKAVGDEYMGERWAHTILPVFTLTEGKLSDFKIYPVDSGYGMKRSHQGRPMLAKEEVGRKIIERYNRMSEPFGTEIEFKDGIGVVKL